MQLRSLLVLGGGAVVTLVIIWWLKSSVSISSPAKNSKDKFNVAHKVCEDSWKSSELRDFYNSIAVIYDFSTITPERLREDVTALVTNLNQNLIAQIILVNNNCENKQTSAEAVRLAEVHSVVRIVLLEADETVSTGRARIEGVAKTVAPFMFFTSAGIIPDSDNFLEHLLYMVSKSPGVIATPSRSKSSFDEVPTLTWSLNIKKADVTNELKNSNDVLLPLIDEGAFLIRSDLYEAVGGYDSFFFKRDNADRIALSLSVWLCGGSVIRTECASVAVKSPSSLYPQHDKAITYLQHAKYIQEVYGGTLADQITYPGIEFYKTSLYDEQAIDSRKQMFTHRGCMTIEWFAHKFNSHFPLKSPKLYDPNYKPVLPVFEKPQRQIGRWFVLFAGHCVKVDDDLVLGLSWCPLALTDHYKFTRLENGQIKVQEKCVTLRLSDFTLVVDDCRKDDNSQIFTYNKSTRQLRTKHDSQCITHFNGPNNRQVLQPGACAGVPPFTKFVFDDEY